MMSNEAKRLTADQWAAVATPTAMEGWALQMVNSDGLVRYAKKVGACNLRVQEMWDPSQYKWQAATDAGFLAEGIAGGLDLAMQAAEHAWQKHNTPVQETYTTKRIGPNTIRQYQPDRPTITVPQLPTDLDLQRLNACQLPAGLQMEFRLCIPTTPESFYITKNVKSATSYWALYALHVDPLYGDRGSLEMPKDARKHLGKSPWATMMMVAHEVPAWCHSTYPDPASLHFSHLVSDSTALISFSRPSVVEMIDPILYGVVVSGKWWGFVPLAEWTL